MRRFVVFVLFTSTLVAAGPVGAQAPPVVLRPPVDAEVLDPFRPPGSDCGSGNRGIEYDTVAGTVVDAAGPGVVVFAGPVAGRTWVTIDHGGGLRTSYGSLVGLRVGRGDVVGSGDPLGTTVGPLHFGARLDDAYVDPASLFGVYVLQVRLVAHERDDHQRWLQLAARDERLRLLEFQASSLGWGGVGPALAVVGEVATDLLALAGLAEPVPCTPPAGALGAAVPRTRRIAVVVDGLDSTSGGGEAMAGLDLVELGYAADDIVRHSYAGGLVPGGGDGWAIERTHYGGDATRGPIEAQIAGLGRTLQAIAAANPGVEIDVYGHSLGGLIVRHALASAATGVPLGVAVTLASPHSGVPLARLAGAIDGTPVASLAAGLAVDGWSGSELASPVIDDLSKSGFAGRSRDVAFPGHVHAVTVGARADLVVPAILADAPRARHVVVGGLDPIDAHGRIAALPEVETEVRLALAGLPPACRGIADRVLDLIVPGAIAFGEQAVVLAALVADRPVH